MPEQIFCQPALAQAKQFILPRRPQHHSWSDHRQQLIATGILEHTAQGKVAVDQHAVVVEALKQGGQAFPGPKQYPFVLHGQAGIAVLV